MICIPHTSVRLTWKKKKVYLLWNFEMRYKAFTRLPISEMYFFVSLLDTSILIIYFLIRKLIATMFCCLIIYHEVIL